MVALNREDHYRQIYPPPSTLSNHRCVSLSHRQLNAFRGHLRSLFLISVLDKESFSFSLHHLRWTGASLAVPTCRSDAHLIVTVCASTKREKKHSLPCIVVKRCNRLNQRESSLMSCLVDVPTRWIIIWFDRPLCPPLLHRSMPPLGLMTNWPGQKIEISPSSRKGESKKTLFIPIWQCCCSQWWKRPFDSLAVTTMLHRTCPTRRSIPWNHPKPTPSEEAAGKRILRSERHLVHLRRSRWTDLAMISLFS